MFRFLHRRGIEKMNRDFNVLLECVQTTLYSELVTEYKEKIKDTELAKVLAARVVNYLTGENNESSYKQADEIMKTKIDKIQDKILPYAKKKMEDAKVRELVVYTLRIKATLNTALKGKAYLETGEMKIIDEILGTYGAEYPAEAELKAYDHLAYTFCKERLKPLLQA